MSRRVALWDFDGTLSRRDSLLPFLRRVRGAAGLAFDLAVVSPWLAAFAAGLVRNDAAKEVLLKRCLGGMALDELRPLARRYVEEELPGLLREDTMGLLRDHQARGDLCVLVSASLDVYLEPWARAAGFDHVLASRLELDGKGKITGRLAGGNCHGEGKVARVKRLLADHEVAHIDAYGDSRGDREMLAMADQAHWVGKRSYSA